jgi:hypothetical protein
MTMYLNGTGLIRTNGNTPVKTEITNPLLLSKKPLLNTEISNFSGTTITEPLKKPLPNSMVRELKLLETSVMLNSLFRMKMKHQTMIIKLKKLFSTLDKNISSFPKKLKKVEALKSLEKCKFTTKPLMVKNQSFLSC